MDVRHLRAAAADQAGTQRSRLLVAGVQATRGDREPAARVASRTVAGLHFGAEEGRTGVGMMRLSAVDHEAALDFVGRMRGVQSPERLAEWVVRELPALVGSVHTSWNVIRPGQQRANVVPSPAPLRPAEIDEPFDRLFHQHPCIQYVARSGDPRPVKISDFQRPRDFQRLALYEEVYEPLGCVDQMGFCVGDPGTKIVAVAVSRERPDFRERDRALLERLRPHLAAHYANCVALARARAALAAHESAAEALGFCVLVLDAAGRPLEIPRRAEVWLRRYFGPVRGTRLGGLPEPVERWVARSRGRAGAARPWLRSRPGGRLALRLLPVREGGTTLLMQEWREEDATGAPPLEALGLTARELEVLRELEHGLTDREIGDALHISRRTVQKHLEHAFRKLGVGTRTAAVTRLRAARRASQYAI